MTQTTQGLSRNSRRKLIAFGLLVASVYVCVALLTDPARLRGALRQLGWPGCVAVLGLALLNYLLRFERWQYYLHRLGQHLPAGRHLLYYLSGFAFTVSPARAGEAVRSLYLRDHGVTYTESIAALFVERLLDLCAIVVLASMIAVEYPPYRFLIVASIALLAAVLSAACQDVVLLWVEALAAHFTGRVAKLLGAFAGLMRSSRRLLHPRPLLFGFALGLVAWGAQGIGLYLIGEGLNISGSPAAYVGIYAMAVLAGNIAFFLPAGIGGTEIVMTTLLVERGATLRAAVIATLLCGLANLWFAVIIGVGAASAVELTQGPVRVKTAP